MSSDPLGTLVVVYGDDVADSDKTAKVELDGVLNLDEDGETTTSFAPGDDVYFLVYIPDGLQITDVISTDGEAVATGAVTREREDELLFVGEDAASLQYLPSSTINVEWQGREGSGMQRDETELTIDGGCPALAKITYDVDFYSYHQVSPSLDLAEGESYTVKAVVYVDVAT